MQASCWAAPPLRMQVQALLALAHVYVRFSANLARGRQGSARSGHGSQGRGGGGPAAAWATEDELWEQWFRSGQGQEVHAAKSEWPSMAAGAGPLPGTAQPVGSYSYGALGHAGAAGADSDEAAAESFGDVLAADGWLSLRTLSMAQLREAFVTPLAAAAGCSWCAVVVVMGKGGGAACSRVQHAACMQS